MVEETKLNVDRLQANDLNSIVPGPKAELSFLFTLDYAQISVSIKGDRSAEAITSLANYCVKILEFRLGDEGFSPDLHLKSQNTKSHEWTFDLGTVGPKWASTGNREVTLEIFAGANVFVKLNHSLSSFLRLPAWDDSLTSQFNASHPDLVATETIKVERVGGGHGTPSVETTDHGLRDVQPKFELATVTSSLLAIDRKHAETLDELQLLLDQLCELPIEKFGSAQLTTILDHIHEILPKFNCILTWENRPVTLSISEGRISIQRVDDQSIHWSGEFPRLRIRERLLPEDFPEFAALVQDVPKVEVEELRDMSFERFFSYFDSVRFEVSHRILMRQFESWLRNFRGDDRFNKENFPAESARAKESFVIGVSKIAEVFGCCFECSVCGKAAELQSRIVAKAPEGQFVFFHPGHQDPLRHFNSKFLPPFKLAPLPNISEIAQTPP